MRLFIALNFGPENKQLLDGIAQDLRALALAGRPVSKDNHHLTLAFIGESNAVEAVSYTHL